ncbi:MAG: class I SAM-dependent methyltransferase [Blastochloris sp.]|nr:class I SAM-dependent methyltransferase [Blastochloris sp.]
MSTPVIYDKVLRLARTAQTTQPFQDHLDIGSGQGELIRILRAEMGVCSRACDYTDSLMRLEGQSVDVANLNEEKLPYPDASFDLVTATEVIEHLEHYRETLREIHRVLRPGGVCILSTPNVLNINSRLRYFFTGFANLFGPLPIKNSALYSTGGHINPVGYFYIAHSLYDAGFHQVQGTMDKPQRSGLWKLLLLGPLIWAGAALAWSKERRRYHTITPENQPILHRINSLDLLLGRTVIVTAHKEKP